MVKVFSLLFALILFSGCQLEENRDKTKSSVGKQDTTKEKTKATFYSALATEMKSLDAQLDTLTSDSVGIVAVIISRVGEECSLMMGTQPFYNSQRLDGAFFINHRLFAIYVEDSLCSKGLINFDQLQVPELTNFPNENNFEPLGSYEPWGRKYKIHSPDSLELVYTGYL